MILKMFLENKMIGPGVQWFELSTAFASKTNASPLCGMSLKTYRDLCTNLKDNTFECLKFSIVLILYQSIDMCNTTNLRIFVFKRCHVFEMSSKNRSKYVHAGRIISRWSSQTEKRFAVTLFKLNLFYFFSFRSEILFQNVS